MKRVIRLCFVLILSVTSLSVAQIQLSAPEASGEAATYINLPIKVSDLTDLDIYSYQFQINFDSTVIKPLNVSVGNSITAQWDSAFYNFNYPGTLYIGAMGLTPLSGEGTLINILFDLIGKPGTSTELVLVEPDFGDGSIPVEASDGAIKINTNLIQVIISSNVPEFTQIIVDDTLQDVPYKTTWIKGTQHLVDAPSPQELSSNVRYSFNKWDDGGAQQHSVSSYNDTSFTAYFSAQYYLSLISDFGQTYGEAWYDSGTVAHFSVDAQDYESETTRHQFISWTGSGEGSYNGAQRESSVVMNNPITEHANWNTEFYLQVISDLGNPYGEGWYLDGDTAEFGLELTELLGENERHYFNSWIGQGNGSYNGDTPCEKITMENPVIETANWNVEYYVNISSNPSGLIEIEGSGWYHRGDSLTMVTAPDTVVADTLVYLFKNWKVNDEKRNENPLNVRVDSALTISADYGYEIGITVTTNLGSGTRVIVDNVEYDAPYVTKWLSDDEHVISVKEQLNLGEGTRLAFKSWNTGDNRIQTVAPMNDMFYIARLDTQFYLEVMTNVREIVNIEGSAWYDANDSAVIKAPEYLEAGDLAYRFLEWNVDSVTVGGNPITIIIDYPQIAEACYRAGYNISGAIMSENGALDEVQIVLSGAFSDTLFTKDNGEYMFIALPEGSYELKPIKDGLRFEPESIIVENLNAHVANQNFAAFDTTTTVNIEHSHHLPDQFQLEQNYPNPFNSTTIIRFSIPKKSKVSLKVYNLLGQPVITLVPENELSGHHQVHWQGLNDLGQQVPSGIYFYKLTINSLVFTRKMILLE